MNEYFKIIPMRYFKKSKVNGYAFLIRNPWHQLYKYVQDENGDVLKIPESAYCEIIRDRKIFPLLVEKQKFPKLSEAILLLGKLLFTGVKAQKYLYLYQAYECLDIAPKLIFSSVRHSLSHASSALTRPNTINTLENMFGGTSIDLKNPKHERLFYLTLAELLVENDNALYHKLLSCEGLWSKIRTAIPLQDWQVEDEHT